MTPQPFSIDTLLERAATENASDLHVTSGSSPLLRIRGQLAPLEEFEAFSPEDTRDLLYRVLSTEQQKRLEIDRQIDFSYSVPGIARFRVNVYFQRDSLAAAFRLVPQLIKSAQDLGLPEVLLQLAREPRGLVLVTGPTGSGKSTTLATMIDSINESRPMHIVTIEDPIEFLHQHKTAVVNQREVGADAKGFSEALRGALRQDPDVILVGEMRDLETISTALTAAETGHLVLSTLHTLDASETINRIIDFFPPHLQQQARVMLASTLKGAISQRLVPRVDIEGRVAVAEIMVTTGRIQDLILNPEETGRITEVIAEGSYYGMQTFDQALLTHVVAQNISEETAFEVASSAHDFKLMLAAQGQRASGIEQVTGNGDDAEGSLHFVKR